MFHMNSETVNSGKLALCNYGTKLFNLFFGWILDRNVLAIIGRSPKMLGLLMVFGFHTTVRLL